MLKCVHQTLVLVLFITLCLSQGDVHGQTLPSTNPSNALCASRDLGKGLVLRAYREHRQNLADYSGVLGSRLGANASGFWVLKIGLVLPGADEIPIWTELCPEDNATPPQVVLDANLRDGILTFGIYYGPVIFLYRYNLSTFELETASLEGDWNMIAKLTLIIPGEVKLKLDYGENGLMTVDVVQRVGKDIRTTHYKQLADKWQFEYISAKGPIDRPGSR